jgi:hypothetical protein
MTNKDKTERMELVHAKMWSLQLFRVDRRANHFQVSDPQGALPSHASLEQWKQKMTLEQPNKDLLSPFIKSSITSTTTTRREWTLNDKDLFSPTSSTSNFKGGLKVHIVLVQQRTSSLSPSKKESESVSVNLIKEREGVDAKALTESREQLEDETAKRQTTPSASSIDAADAASSTSNDDDCLFLLQDLFSNMEQTRTEVTRHQKDLQRLLLQSQSTTTMVNNEDDCAAVVEDQESYEDDLWELRDTLREKWMLHGSAIFRYHDVYIAADNNGKGPNYSNSQLTCQEVETLLKESETCFQRALEEVKHLATMENTSSSNWNDNDDDDGGDGRPKEDVAVKRTLYLLRGRATVNLGIALFHQALWNRHKSAATLGRRREVAVPSKAETDHTKTLLEQAMVHYKRAQKWARRMSELCVAPTKGGDSLSFKSNSHSHMREERLDSFRSRELESFSLQWQGRATWSLGHYKDAAKLLDQASTMVPPSMITARRVLDQHHPADGAVMFKCLVAHYDAATVLVDLASTEMEHIRAIGLHLPPREKMGHELLALSFRSYKRAMDISNATISVSTEQQRQEEGVQTVDKLKQAMKELSTWWNDAKEKKKMARQQVVPLGVNISTLTSKKNNTITGKRSISALSRSDVHVPIRSTGGAPPTVRVIDSLALSRRRNHKRALVHHNNGVVSSRKVASSCDDVNEAFSNISSTDTNTPIPIGPALHHSSMDGSTTTTSVVVHRKWGDELLPLTPGTQDGRASETALEYPSAAPPRPSWMHAP